MRKHYAAPASDARFASRYAFRADAARRADARLYRRVAISKDAQVLPTDGAST